MRASISYYELESANFPALFQPLKSLEVLYLTSIELDDVLLDLFRGLDHLRFINLDRNHLKNLSRQLLADLASLRSIAAVTPAAGFVEFDISPCDIDVSMYCFVATSLLVLLTLALSLTYTKANIYCRYLWYMLKAWLEGRRVDKLGKGCWYDAFVSYSSSDEAWVVDQLLPQLEQRGPEWFQLCLHSRDFELGMDIFRNIEKAIHSSRKTLCVISSQYLRSEWCSLEYQLTSLRLFCDQNDVLIVIFLEDIPNFQLSACHKLRKLVKSKTYIEWPEEAEKQVLFWARLREALRHTAFVLGVYQIGDLVLL
uniref:toll-like receptor 13 n=1 Tax=Pristiophorus japonicus TaxID=55135 RepID=UPI00398EFADF